jgi:hypothetical protein
MSKVEDGGCAEMTWTLDVGLWTLDTAFSVLYFFAMSEQTCEPLQTPIDNDLLDPYERLVKIEVLGKRVEVPEKNRLLRCFQFLSLKTISYGDFCWNGDCTNCQIWYHTAGQSKADDKPALACRLEVIEEMTITSMAPFIKLEGITQETGKRGKGEEGKA